MNNTELQKRFVSLATPQIADACIRLNIEIRLAPFGIKPNIGKAKLAGKVLPVKHFGSVDVFLEASAFAKEGDVFVIDNNGRNDEGCIGDLTVLEAIHAKVAGFVIWGTHRDFEEVRDLGFPVFSYGTWSSGPLSLRERTADALEKANVGNIVVTKQDCVFADSNGVIFVPIEKVESVLDAAEQIYQTEQKQAAKVKAGISLKEQLQFYEYLKARVSAKDYTFREHLRKIKGAIEE